MLCNEFEEQLSGYLDGELPVETNRLFAEHALRCPVCHDLLSEVKNTLLVCSSSEAPPAGAGLEARILMATAPETTLTCAQFEEHLTDYLDGFLLAPLYHRWERHAALCAECSALPGDVVRSIGACYTYLQEELAVPAGLEARILQSTIGNVVSREVRAPLMSRLIEWLRGALDPIVSPQLATVATMLLVAVFVLTNTVSTDGSVGGIYHASLQLAERTADNATRSKVPAEIKQVADDLMNSDSGQEKAGSTNKSQNPPKQSSSPANSQNNSKPKSEPSQQEKR
jgi:anti-sigma factor RsiW